MTSVAHPHYLHRFLAELKTKPKKSLSQNFLIDQNVVKKIVAAMQLQGEPVVEIGPGPGALTELLAQKTETLYLVEKDRTFAKALGRFSGAQIFEGDILDFDCTPLPEKCKVVSNLPYHLTTPILTTLLPQHEKFSTLTLMMQKEVGQRLLAQPKSKEYGALTLFAQFYGDIINHFTVKASCFFPRPKVDSVVVTFALKKPPADIDEKRLFALTRAAFGQRRKMLRSSLKELCDEALFQKARIAPTLRAEELSLEEFIFLAAF